MIYTRPAPDHHTLLIIECDEDCTEKKEVLVPSNEMVVGHPSRDLVRREMNRLGFLEHTTMLSSVLDPVTEEWRFGRITCSKHFPSDQTRDNLVEAASKWRDGKINAGELATVIDAWRVARGMEPGMRGP